MTDINEELTKLKAKIKDLEKMFNEAMCSKKSKTHLLHQIVFDVSEDIYLILVEKPTSRTATVKKMNRDQLKSFKKKVFSADVGDQISLDDFDNTDFIAQKKKGVWSLVHYKN